MSIRGVDISDNNGTLNWDIIKEQIDFAIVMALIMNHRTISRL